jgi:hypothetical protein
MSNMREPRVRNPLDQGRDARLTAALRAHEQRAIGLSVQRIATRRRAADVARAVEPEPEQTADPEPEQQQLEDAAELMHIMNEVVSARAAEAAAEAAQDVDATRAEAVAAERAIECELDRQERQGQITPAFRGPDVSPVVSDSTKRKRHGKKIRTKENRARAKKQKVDSGFTLATRGSVRAAGGAVASGDARTCLPDAVWVSLHLLGVKVNQKSLREALPATESEDPNMQQVEEFCMTHGVSLEYRPSLCLSPVGLFRQEEGVYLMVLELLTPSGAVDFHAVVYDATTGQVLDNEPAAKVPVVDDTDRESNHNALLVFKQLFPRALKIKMTQVYKVSK